MMRRPWTTVLCVCVSICVLPALAGAEAKTVRATRGVPRTPRSNAKATSVLEENIRLVLRIRMPDAEPRSVSVVTAHGRVSLDDIAGMAEIDGNAVPIVLRFEASLESLGEGEYFVSCTYGASTPVVTASSVTKGGAARSSFQYQDMGVQASARMRIGTPITLLQDPDKEVSLELQSVQD